MATANNVLIHSKLELLIFIIYRTFMKCLQDLNGGLSLSCKIIKSRSKVEWNSTRNAELRKALHQNNSHRVPLAACFSVYKMACLP
jgi:hypothetical protein